MAKAPQNFAYGSEIREWGDNESLYQNIHIPDPLLFVFLVTAIASREKVPSNLYRKCALEPKLPANQKYPRLSRKKVT